MKSTGTKGLKNQNLQSELSGMIKLPLDKMIHLQQPTTPS